MAADLLNVVFAGQVVGSREVRNDIWLVSLMDYDLGYFDLETWVLEPLENPMYPVRCVTYVSGPEQRAVVRFLRIGSQAITEARSTSLSYQMTLRP